MAISLLFGCCQPSQDSGSLAQHLREHGAGISAIVCGCPGPVVRLGTDSRWEPLPHDPNEALTGLTDASACCYAGSRSIVGFDIVLEPPEAEPTGSKAEAASRGPAE